MVRSFNRVDYPALDYCAIELQDFPDELRKVRNYNYANYYRLIIKHILMPR